MKIYLFRDSVSVRNFFFSFLCFVGFCNIRWESWSTHSFGATIIIRTRGTCHTFITIGRSNAVHISIWFYRSTFLLVAACRHVDWHFEWYIFLSDSIEPNWSGCWIGTAGASRSYINTITANVSTKTRKNIKQQPSFDELIDITFLLQATVITSQ